MKRGTALDQGRRVRLRSDPGGQALVFTVESPSWILRASALMQAHACAPVQSRPLDTELLGSRQVLRLTFGTYGGSRPFSVLSLAKRKNSLCLRVQNENYAE